MEKITKVDKYMKLPEILKDGYGEETMHELNHFLIQLVRIPTTEQCTARKLIQVALNIGQGLAEIELTKSKEKLYSTKINSYISVQNLKKLSVSDADIKAVLAYLKSY